MFSKLSIKVKLMFVNGLAIVTIVCLGIIAEVKLKQVLGAYNHVVETNMPSLRAINEARHAMRDTAFLVMRIIVSGKPVSDVDKVKADFDLAVKKYDKATKEYQDIAPAEGEQVLRDDVAKAWKEVVTSSGEVVALADSEKPADLARRTQIDNRELSDARKHFRDSFAALVKFHDEESAKWSEKAEKTADRSSKTLLISIILSSILVMVFGFRIAQSLTKVLTSISKQVNDSSQMTVETCQRVSQASDQLASSSTQQASSLQLTAASMEEISAMVNKNADSAQKTRQISEGAQTDAIQGKEVVDSMVAAIEQISQSNVRIGSRIEQSNQEMSEIIKVIAEIESKTKIINDIVFQTKLLSFNASVEAARAGEHGKGFAVVAEEVGNLAQMSGEASQSITAILQQSTRRVQEIVQSSSSQIGSLLSENKEKISEGVHIAERCKSVLESLVDNVTNVNGMANDIALASTEQSQGVREVNTAVAQLDGVVQESTSATQTLSSAAQSLLTQTENLNGVATELSEVIHGRAA